MGKSTPGVQFRPMLDNEVEIIGAPFDLTGRLEGSRHGPGAIRLAGLVDRIRPYARSVRDLGDIVLDESSDYPIGGMKQFGAAHAAYGSLKRAVGESLARGSVPVVLGGDHGLSIGSISAALERFQKQLAVLWIDAHPDLNVLYDSPSGNLHGMAVALLLGLESRGKDQALKDWDRLLSEIVPQQRLRGDAISWLGLREVDNAERQAINALPHCFAATMHEVDKQGLTACIGQWHEWMVGTGCGNLWVSFDVDALDPTLAPGTGTTVRGGFTYREAHLIAELLSERLSGQYRSYRLVGMDVVETNPLADTRNETAIMAVECIASLLGKTIL